MSVAVLRRFVQSAQSLVTRTVTPEALSEHCTVFTEFVNLYLDEPQCVMLLDLAEVHTIIALRNAKEKK